MKRKEEEERETREKKITRRESRLFCCTRVAVLPFYLLERGGKLDRRKEEAGWEERWSHRGR